MSTATRTISFFLRKLWTLVAIVLVAFALVISAARYALPLVNDYKPQIKQYVQNKYGIDLDIQRIEADWQASGPKLVLQQVSLTQSDASPVKLDIQRVELLVDFWPTLFNLTLHSKDVALKGLHLNIDSRAFAQDGNDDVAIIKLLESVFLEHLTNFSVAQSQISVVRNENVQSINIPTLTWLNKDQRHQATGFLSLDNFANENISFVLDLKGDIASYSGTFYALGRQVDVSPWLNKMTDFDTELVSSDANFQVWASINAGELQQIRARLLPTSIQWQGKDTPVSSTFVADMQADYFEQKWQFVINDFSIELPDKAYSTDWIGEWEAGSHFVLQAQQNFNLDNWFAVLGIIDTELAELLSDSRLNVALYRPQIFVVDNKFGLSIPQGNINLPQQEIAPGIQDLGFSMQWYDGQGKLHIEQSMLSLVSSTMFMRDMQLTEIDLDLYMSRDETGFRFLAPDYTVLADGWRLHGQAAFNSGTNFLALSMQTDELDLKRVSEYFPHHLMGEQTISYLQRAFVGEGRITQAKVLWHGEITQFPFKQNQGVFNIHVGIEDADFQFAPDWPTLTELDINLNFLNQGLFMTSPSSQLAGIQLNQLSAEIDHLGRDALLTIQADGTGTGRDVTELMLASSLHDSVGKVLSEQVIVNGQLSTQLALSIPLTQSPQVDAKGVVSFTDNGINIAALDLDLSHADGQLTFNNQNLLIQDLSASLFGQDIELSMRSQQKDSYELEINIEGTWDVEKSLHDFDMALQGLSGSFTYDLDVLVNILPDDYAYRATLTSDLVNLDSTLPFPFSKTASSGKSLVVNAQGDKIASTLELMAGEDIRFDGTIAHRERIINRAHLAIGNTEVQSLGLGFSISANFDELPLDHWITTINQLTANLENGRGSLLGLPQRIFVTADTLTIANQTLTDINSITRRNTDNWNIELNADEVRADVTIFDKRNAKGILIDADFIKLPDVTFEQSQSRTLLISDIDPKRLPSINFNCKECLIGKYPLGKVELEATPNSDGLEINQLLLDNGQATLSAQGQWYQRQSDHYTFLAGDFSSQDFGRFLQVMSLDSGIRDSSANMNFALTWQNSPMDFSIGQLNGELTWQLTDGYLSDVSDKGSRIFTLLSLNSLVRKLSLDFRDVFAKGFFYDDMSGSIQVTQGKADTRDTVIDGAAGEIEIYGYTDLTSKELNYNVSFAPNVTGNLPALVYFFTVSPPTALAALAIDQMLTSAKVISNVNYSVTGTINDPILIETGRDSTDVELPALQQNNAEETNDIFIPPSSEEFIELR